MIAIVPSILMVSAVIAIVPVSPPAAHPSVKVTDPASSVAEFASKLILPISVDPDEVDCSTDFGKSWMGDILEKH